MTPPRPTASAAELHADLLRMSGAEPDSRMGKAIDALIAAVRSEALVAVTDAIEAASRGNSAQTQAAQDDGDDEKARMLILWGGGIVEALATVRALVSK